MEKINVLAVDDEEHILEIYKGILSPEKKRTSRRLAQKRSALQKQDYDLTIALSGEEGIEKAKALYDQGKRFSVGFFDMHMPGMDGAETIHAMLEIDPDIQCVVVTAYTDRTPDDIVALFHDPSQFVYLNKPFNVAEIAQLALSLSSGWTAKRDTVRMLESIVEASVQAIESRDPTTAGHSERVSELTLGMAECVNDSTEGVYEKITFNRYQMDTIRYASLLHDFGKIGVREQILLKANKLYPKDLERISLNFELEEYRGTLSHDQRLKWWEEILEANRPSILPSAIQFDLDEIYKKKLINDEEYNYLTIPRGTLTNEERREIENHVTVTYRFLNTISWTKDFENVPNIAWCHHEKMDGSGYPRGVKEIPMESKMMAIADIFDALTASDRPYKKAVPLNRALDIIKYEVNDGKLDKDIYEIFLKNKIYERVLEND